MDSIEELSEEDVPGEVGANLCFPGPQSLVGLLGTQIVRHIQPH